MKYFQALILLLLISCHPLFCNWDKGYSKIEMKIDLNKIIGVYKIENDNSIFPKEIKLTENGKYYFSETESTLFNNGGKWMRIFSNEENIIDLENRVVRLEEKNGNFALLFSIGDPDNCEGIIYIKE